MFANKEVIPLISADCSKSTMLINFSYNNFKSADDFFQVYTRDKILQSILNIDYSYETLKIKYAEVCNSMVDNDFFGVTYKVNHCFNLKISDTIQIFHFDERFRIHGQKLFIWDFPQNVTTFGNCSNYGDKEIISDFVNLDLLSWFFKYYLGVGINNHAKLMDIIPTDSGYMVNGILHIVLDSHISFVFDNEKLYIADTWWNTNEEIIDDIRSLPLSEFGLKYKSFWC